jgi:hypothetical protein
MHAGNRVQGDSPAQRALGIVTPRQEISMKTKNKSAKPSKPSKAPVPRRVAIGKSARSAEPTAQSAVQATTQPTADASHATNDTKPTKPIKQPRTAKPAKQPRAPKPAKEPKPRRTSALDAAAIVLADVNKPLRTVDLIAEMQSRGLWVSPGGKTPEATLYAAMIREINTKGDTARFKKVDRGLFEVRLTSGGEA